jgi:hypothetical protein
VLFVLVLSQAWREVLKDSSRERKWGGQTVHQSDT